MVLFIIALLIVALSLFYVARFGYKSSLGQPLRYRKTKKVLTLASVIFVCLAVVALIADGSYMLPIAFVVVSLAAGHIVKFRNYLRAVRYWSEMKDPKTGDYVYSGNAQKRDKTARIFIDAEIAAGERV